MATFIGKGNRKAEVDLHPATTRFCTSIYKVLYRRQPKPEDKLFPSIPLRINKKRKPGKVLTSKDVGEELHKFEKELNEGDVLGRHFVGTQLVRTGMPIHRVAKVLRHRDITTTQIYVHDSPGSDDVWKRVDALRYRPRTLAEDDDSKK